MKTQTYGIGDKGLDPKIETGKSGYTDISNYSKGRLRAAHEKKEESWTSYYLRPAYTNYRVSRENGKAQDTPSEELQYDGKAEWELQADGHYHVKYTEGPSDKLWMEAKDRNYVFRLESEGTLDQLEPNLQTEVPKLYEEVMAYRAKRAAEAKTYMETETRKANGPKPM